MNTDDRIGRALRRVLDDASGPGCPPRLRQAIEYAVFPGGHRIRPRLCLAVALAHAGADDDVVDAALVSIELLHCASLVHDDMPCFDDARIRRGKATLHVTYGDALALLSGDALIVMAFQALAKVSRAAPRRGSRLMEIVSLGVGAPQGIVAGQAWECEPAVPVDDYHRAKTGALFAAATMAGAAAAGVDHEPWGELGERIGRAYQVADDLLDKVGDPDVIGKPVNQDSRQGKPSMVSAMGIEGAREHLRRMISKAVDAVPACPGEAELRELIRREAGGFMNQALSARAAA